jgi:hypothetical protein
VSDERRQAPRLHLTKPVEGWFGDFPITLIDVSETGAAVLHGDEIPVGSRGLLRFSWRGEELEITAEIVHSREGRAGLRFVEKSELLGGLIAASGDEVLRAQEANLRGEREKNVVGEETLTAASFGARAARGYIMFRLTADGWTQAQSLLPDQPDDGFTVSADEPQDQIDILCKTYETGDADAKKMMRAIAELSVRR